MKNLFYIGIVSAFLLGGLTGCYKTCEDPFAPNYTLKGACIDLTASITGTYTGQLQDSIVGLHNSSINNVSIQVTKVDDQHVTVASSGTSSFVSYSAIVVASTSGYYLTIPQQTNSSNGLTVIGAATYFGNPADGIYITGTRQLTISSLAGTQYQTFTGTQQ